MIYTVILILTLVAIDVMRKRHFSPSGFVRPLRFFTHVADSARRFLRTAAGDVHEVVRFGSMTHLDTDRIERGFTD